MGNSIISIFRRRTIARDLTIGLALTIISVTVSISLLNYFFSVSRTERLLSDQAVDVIDKLSAVLVLPLWNLDTKSIEFVAEAYQQTENVVALRVLNEAEEVIYEKAASEQGELITATRPISYGGQHIGTVEVSLTKRNIIEIQKKTLHVTLVIMFCVILSVVVVTLILLKVFLTRPLAKLTQGIEIIASGSYDHVLAPVSQSDIDVIIQKVNLMASQIAERDRALRESMERYEDLANLLPETIYEIDERGNFTFLNRSGFECFGYTQTDLGKGLNILQLFVPGTQKRANENMRRIMAGEKLGANEYMAQRKDGTTFPVLVHSSPIMRRNKPAGLRAIAVDITDRKRIEEELGKLATGVAHQVRNPVMTIGGFVRRLQKRFPPDTPPQDWLKIILLEVRRLERMVRDIHRHTSLRKPELRLTSLLSVAENVLEECLQDTNAKEIRLKKEFSREAPQVLADGDLLGLALTNILTNAMEAMPEGGDLSVSIFPEGDRVCISIKDSGVGIPSEDLPHVFDPFFSSNPQASGLGLTTAQRIIADHKAEIRINSTPGMGTKVQIWFPAARPVSSVDSVEQGKSHR